MDTEVKRNSTITLSFSTQDIYDFEKKSRSDTPTLSGGERAAIASLLRAGTVVPADAQNDVNRLIRTLEDFEFGDPAACVAAFMAQDGTRIVAEFGDKLATGMPLSCPNQREVQSWLDQYLLDTGFYDEGRWFLPAWIARLKPADDLPVPGGHKYFHALIQAPYVGSLDTTRCQLRDRGLEFIDVSCSLLWPVLRWAQGGFDDLNIRHNAFQVGLIDPFIPARRWEPIRPNRPGLRDGLPDRASILGKPDPGGQVCA